MTRRAQILLGLILGTIAALFQAWWIQDSTLNLCVAAVIVSGVLALIRFGPYYHLCRDEAFWSITLYLFFGAIILTAANLLVPNL